MTSERVLQSVERVIDDLCRDGDEVSRDEIYDRVERGRVAPEVATYFSHLPDGDYTIDELVDELGAQVYQAGDAETGRRGTRGQ